MTQYKNRNKMMKQIMISTSLKMVMGVKQCEGQQDNESPILDMQMTFMLKLITLKMRSNV